MAIPFESRIHPYQGDPQSGKSPKWTAEVILRVGDQVVIVPCHDSEYDDLSDWARNFQALLAKAEKITIERKPGT